MTLHSSENRIRRIAILASGNGSNAENIVAYIRTHRLPLIVATVVSDNQNAFVRERMERYKIPVSVIAPSKGFSREAHEKLLLDHLRDYEVDWVLLAGYMRLLTSFFLGSFSSRVVNIHPSLLPAFPGCDAYQKAWNANVATSGVTIHFVDEGMDTGRIILQEKFSRNSFDTFEMFHKRGLELEYSLYRKFLDQLVNGHFYYCEEEKCSPAAMK